MGNEQLQMQQAFMAYLALKYKTLDIDSLIKQLESTPGESGETKLQDELVEFQQLIQSQQTLTMKNGAQINYLKKLRGGCPDGYTTEYYKKGGKVCSKCVKKAEEGMQTPLKKQYFKKGPVINPNDTIHTKKATQYEKDRASEKDYFNGIADHNVREHKYGEKTKKKKMQEGAVIPEQKYGAKLKKKCQFGGTLYFN